MTDDEKHLGLARLMFIQQAVKQVGVILKEDKKPIKFRVKIALARLSGIVDGISLSIPVEVAPLEKPSALPTEDETEDSICTNSLASKLRKAWTGHENDSH